MSSIKLESDLNWWWYKSKEFLLLNILEKHFSHKKIKILEIGPGKGNNLNILNKFGSIDILEIEENFLKDLQQNFDSTVNNYFKDIEEVGHDYDLIVMLDVLEHILNSKEYMNNLSNKLVDNGKIILGVPAYQNLWSSHDIELRHFRRYNWKTIKEDCKIFNISEKYGLNYLVLPIRFFQIKLFRNIDSTKSSNKLANLILLYFVLVEKTLRKVGLNPKFGLSLYCILEKNNLSNGSI